MQEPKYERKLSLDEKLILEPKDVNVFKCDGTFYSGKKRGAYPLDHGQSAKKTAFIINILAHPIETQRREGTDVDRDLLVPLCSQLGFTVRVFNDTDPEHKADAVDPAHRHDAVDLSAAGFGGVLDAIATDVTHAESNCLMLFILSHGNKVGADEVIECTDGNVFKKNDIIDRFRDEQCPALKGKPRLIFLASCRGTEKLFVDRTDAVAITEHFFVGLPCQEGYTAIRNKKYGSRYIRAIVKVFMENAHNSELLELMSQVQVELNEMVKYDHVNRNKPDEGYFAMHQESETDRNLVHKLLKNFYFFP